MRPLRATRSWQCVFLYVDVMSMFVSFAGFVKDYTTFQLVVNDYWGNIYATRFNPVFKIPADLDIYRDKTLLVLSSSTYERPIIQKNLGKLC